MRPLRIALTADPYIPLPPTHQGGIERIVDFLARGLAARGHELTVFAHPASRVPGKLVPYGIEPHTGIGPRLTEVYQVGAGLWKGRHDFDLVHSFGRLAALLPVLPLRRLPKIQSYQRPSVPWRGVRQAVRLARSSMCFTACSSSVYGDQALPHRRVGRWHTVFNGVELDKYTYVAQVDENAPLVFLGQLEFMKGPHIAIEIARASGRRLVIAGNRVETAAGRDYFDRELAPHFDGESVQYIGPVDDRQKNSLLGSSSALLFPTLWKEAFGIVMAEAMACGTPVVAFARGSVPEVVANRRNGYVCETKQEAIQAVAEIHRISRQAVRIDCERRFSSQVIVDAYEALYGTMLHHSKSSDPTKADGSGN